MKELFIKCPSCGTVLGVKNSKNEAVKKITCPQCHQRLAVSFEEELPPSPATPQPLGALYYGEMRIALQEGVNNTQFPGSEKVSLEVVRLADGSSKCMIQPLLSDSAVKVNGESLQKGDKVVLEKGDKLEIDHVVLFYNKPYSLPVDEPKQEKQPTQIPSTPQNGKKGNGLLYAAIGMIAFALAASLLWSRLKDMPQAKNDTDSSMVNNPPKEGDATAGGWPILKHGGDEATTPTEKASNTGGENNRTPETTEEETTKYDLERAASHGDTEALLKLGRQLVKDRESNRVILGMNYLHQAALKGSGEANRLWKEMEHALQQRAANDSAAIYILNKIDR